MIEITNVEINGWQAAIRGMRNSHNSWDKSDSEFGIGTYKIGPNDMELMKELARAGSCHAKYRRTIVVWCDINAPLYWWKEFDTYKVGTVANSCSTMHSVTDKKFTIDDFSHEHLGDNEINILAAIVKALNIKRNAYLGIYKKEKYDREEWYSIIQLLPSSYNQIRTVMLNYEVLAQIYNQRKDHPLDEWRTFCDWIVTSLPAPYLITLNDEECNEHD